MLRYIATPSINEDDIATDVVGAICPFLAVLRYDLISRPGIFTVKDFFTQVSVIAKYSDLIDDCTGREKYEF